MVGFLFELAWLWHCLMLTQLFAGSCGSVGIGSMASGHGLHLPLRPFVVGGEQVPWGGGGGILKGSIRFLHQKLWKKTCKIK